MAFEKLEDLLPYSVHKIEEKYSMKPEEANKMYEEERENNRFHRIYGRPLRPRLKSQACAPG